MGSVPGNQDRNTMVRVAETVLLENGVNSCPWPKTGALTRMAKHDDFLQEF